MAITYQSEGALAYGSTSVAPAYPSSIAAGDYLVMFVGTKPNTATVVTPAGWTVLNETSGGGGTTGADTGPTKLVAFGRVALGSESGTQSVSITSGNSSWGQIYRISNSTGGWNTFAAGGTDSTTGSAWSVSVTAANGSLAADDLVLVGSCIPTDVTTPSQFSGEAVTASGVTLGTMTEISEPDSGTGNDIGGFVFRQPVDSGSNTSNLTVSATAGGTTTNVRGPSVVVRLREAIAPPQRILFRDSAEAWSTTTRPKTTSSFDVEAGDLIVVFAASNTPADTFSDPSASGGSVTWTLEENYTNVSGYCPAYIWSGIVGSTASGITVSVNNGSSGPLYGFSLTLWRNHGGIGVSGKTNAATPSGGALVNLTLSQSSAAMLGFGDGWAQTTATTWRSGMFEEKYYTQAGQYSAGFGYLTHCTSPGSTALGVSAPTAQQHTAVAIEILPLTTYEGSAAQTIAAVTQSASGSHTAPSFTGTSAQTLAAATQSAAGSHVAFKGPASQTLAAATQSASGSRTVPAFTGTSAQTLAAATQAASGSHTPPSFTGTATSPLAAATQAAAGDFTAPGFSGTAAQTLAAATQAAAGDHTPPVFSGTATSALAPATQAAAGGIEFSGTATSALTGASQSATGEILHYGTAAQTLAAATQAAAGEHVPPPVSGTADSVLAAAQQAAAGTRTVPGFSGTADSVLAAATQSGAGDHTPPSFTGTAAQTLPSATTAASGSATPPEFSGTGASALAAATQAAEGSIGTPGGATSVLPALEQSASGSHTPPAFTGTATSPLAAATQAAAGTSGAPSFDGPATSTLPALTQSASGERTMPVFTGTADSDLPSLAQSASGSHTPPSFTGTAASPLPALTQSASGSQTPPLFEGDAISTLPALTSASAGSHTPPLFAGVIGSLVAALVSQGLGGTDLGPMPDLPDRLVLAGSTPLNALTSAGAGYTLTPGADEHSLNGSGPNHTLEGVDPWQ